MTPESLSSQAQGTPASGEFAPNQRSEVRVKLFDRADGSFFNPAPSATAEHCVAFWTGVEVPDVIIEQVVHAYAENRSDEIDLEMEQVMSEWRDRWVEQNPAPKERNIPEYQRRFQHEHEQHRLSVLPGVVAKRPERLGQYDARQLIRATKMLINRPHPDKFPGEGDKVLAEKIELFDGDMTVLEIERKYRLTQVRSSMDKVQRREHDALLAALESQREELAGIREQLVYQRNDMSGN